MIHNEVKIQQGDSMSNSNSNIAKKPFSDSKIIERANQLRDNDLYFFFRAIEDTAASTVTVKGQKQIMIGSNNYLGLTHHPLVKESAIKAIEKYGTGCAGSRFLNGTLDIHIELEEQAKKVGGHGGMDFIMDYRLIYCLQNGLPLEMDVYDLAAWCSLAPLTALSLENNSAPVEIPDFTRGNWNDVKGFRHAFAK